mgnify:CR=1 FL=1
MKLKLRYASTLILILLLICIFTWFIVLSVTTGDYLRAILLSALLYCCTFILGKKFRKVFFLLSTITFIKSSNGVSSIAAVENHIEQRGRNSEGLSQEIIELLLADKVVEQQGDRLLLTGE